MEGENWISFERDINKARTIIGVDMQFVENCPDSSRPHLVRIVLECDGVRENGFPDDAEFEVIERAEEALVAGLDKSRAVLVGRWMGDGERDWFCYAADPARLEAHAHRVLFKVQRGGDVRAQHDPDWSWYDQVLLPSPAEYRRVQDEELVERFQADGDPLVVPRAVMHFLYFHDKRQGAALARKWQKKGFKAEWLESEDEEIEEDAQDDPPPRLRLSLEREDPIDLASINALTTELMHSAEKAGGVYDGWEAWLVKPRRKKSPKK